MQIVLNKYGLTFTGIENFYLKIQNYLSVLSY